MAFERRWEGVAPRLLTANGTSNGRVYLSNTVGFWVKQQVIMQSNALQQRALEVKRVYPTYIVVGTPGTGIAVVADVSDFLTADTSTIYAPEQEKTNVPKGDQDQATYQHEPVNARRVALIDEHGTQYGEDNPLPTTATITVGSITVDTDGFDLTDPDSMQITGSEDGTKTGIKHGARVDSALDLRVGISNGANKAGVSSTGELSVVDAEVRTKLTAIGNQLAATLNVSDATAQSLLTTIIAGLVSIDAGIPAALGQNTSANSMSVTLASDQTPIPVISQLSDEPIKISGTKNGQPGGAEFPFVNNERQQILDAHDRKADFTYADFGTKDQRVTQIDYTSATFPGIIVRRTFTFTLVGNNYKRNDELWSLVV